MLSRLFHLNRSHNNDRKSIGPDDVVSIEGRYLVKKDGSRFFMKGIGFPVTSTTHTDNIDGWIAVLDQLVSKLHVDINTVRLYEFNCTIDGTNDYYTEFFQHAAKLGIYVMIPLTSYHVVLNRNLVAPDCYTQELYDYGCTCIDIIEKYPNVVSAVVANEVMNSLETWKAAPCIKAYASDLKLYMKYNNKRQIPLLYAAQHDAVTAEVTASETMRMTMEYLSCDGTQHDNAIDIFGVNVEAWCSSDQTYERNPTGYYPGTYLDLYNHMINTSIPIIFSELGCSRELFNRDNNLLPKNYRDWKQIPVIVNNMSNIWSGFCAYTYSGSPLFDMTINSKWDGIHTLQPNQDLYNFRTELNSISNNNNYSIVLPTNNDDEEEGQQIPPLCTIATQYAEKICMMKLYDVDMIRSYFSSIIVNHNNSSSTIDSLSSSLSSSTTTTTTTFIENSFLQNHTMSINIIGSFLSICFVMLVITIFIFSLFSKKISNNNSKRKNGYDRIPDL